MPSLLVKSTSCGEKLGTSFLRSSDVESRPLLGKQKKPSPSTPSVPCRHDKAKGSTSFFVLVCRRFAVTLFLFVTLLMISKIQQGHIHQKRGGSQDNITHHLPSQDQISSLNKTGSTDYKNDTVSNADESCIEKSDYSVFVQVISLLVIPLHHTIQFLNIYNLDDFLLGPFSVVSVLSEVLILSTLGYNFYLHFYVQMWCT